MKISSREGPETKEKLDQPLIARKGRDYGQENSGRMIRIKRIVVWTRRFNLPHGGYLRWRRAV